MRHGPLAFHALLASLLGTVLAIVPPAAPAAEILIGRATASITPDRPVALVGQMHTRIAKEVESPIIAAAVALESREGQRVVDQAVMVACDLVAIRDGLVQKVRQRLKQRIPDFDPNKLFVSATHTHTAPEVVDGRYDIPQEGVMQPSEYSDFVVERVADAVVEAWESRRPGGVGWGLGHAVVAQNRRAVFANRQAQMYGKTDRADFRMFEGYEDHGVEVLFFWDAEEKLIATAVNVACPSQEVEHRSAVHADFWHEVRERLKQRHGDDLVVLAWTGAAGDQSPHLMYRQRAEERMRELRGLNRLEELARRIVSAWDEAYEGAKKDIRTDVPLVHTVEAIELPLRIVTPEERARAQKQVESLSADRKNHRRMLWVQAVVDRYDQQQSGLAAPYEMELHVVRLGDVAIATNDFELYTDFGVQMKARSPALQTFVIQLAGPGTYLPSERAVRGGGYSAIIESNVVGPQGGQVLVERTLEAIGTLWPQK